MKKILILLPLILITLAAARAETVLKPSDYEFLEGLSPIAGEAPPALAGRPLVVTFFASWCPPCTAEFRELNRLKAALPDQPLSILAINLFESHFPDPGARRLHRFIERSKPSFPLVKAGDNNRLSQIFGQVDRIPTVFIINSNGQEIYRFIHHEGARKQHFNLQEMIAALR